MKELSLEKMSEVSGGGCTLAEGASVAFALGAVALAIAFPPAGFALIFGVGLTTGFGAGAAIAECIDL